MPARGDPTPDQGADLGGGKSSWRSAFDARWVAGILGSLLVAGIIALVATVLSPDNQKLSRPSDAADIARELRDLMTASDQLPDDEDLVLGVRSGKAAEYDDNEATFRSGETAEFLIRRANVTADVQRNVRVFVAVPDDLTIVPGSVRWVYRGIDEADHDVVQEDEPLFSKQVNFGDWRPTSFFFLRFDAVTGEARASCATTVTVQARSRSSAGREIRDNARVRILGERCSS